MGSTDANLGHSSVPARERNALGRYLGNTIRELRQRHALTIAEVAQQAGISRGMLSKIENAQTLASLETLEKLVSVLGISLGDLFQGYETSSAQALLVPRGAAKEVVRRGTRNGHTYQLLATDLSSHLRFESFLVTLDSNAEPFPSFEHPGFESIYVLEGKMQYRHGDKLYLLQEGDTLTFQSDFPHGPEVLIEVPIRFLATIFDARGDAIGGATAPSNNNVEAPKDTSR